MRRKHAIVISDTIRLDRFNSQYLQNETKPETRVKYEYIYIYTTYMRFTNNRSNQLMFH